MSKFEALAAELDAASQLLKSLASPNRLKLLCVLAQGEKSVGQLTEEMGLRQSTVSQNLARLRLDQLVETRREAQTIYYRLADGPAEKVIQVLYNHYCAKEGGE